MRLFIGVGLLLLIGACTLFGPSGQRYVVFFRGSSAQLDDQAKGVLVTAGDRANRYPKMPVLVASYADPYGSGTTNVEFTRLRAQAVIDGLVANGVEASRIQRQDVGPVKFESEPQESRRVVITVGSP
jgi:outer membrane protein OmpA-like peptidoglycan-associated protein